MEMETKLIVFLILSSVIFFGWWYIQSKMFRRPRVVVHSKQNVPETSGLGSGEWLSCQYDRAYAESNIHRCASEQG
jgi:hypothetical protein